LRELSFAPCAASPNFKATQMTIQIAHLAATTLSLTFASNLGANTTTVYNGAADFAGTLDTWSPIGLTSGFLYNGVDSLVVDITFTGATGGWSCHRTSTLPRNYATGPGSSTTPTANGGGLAALKMRLTVDRTLLTLSGTARPGGVVTLDMEAPADANLPYVLGGSLGNGPIPIDTRQLGLSPDDLLVVTTFGLLPAIFVGYSGVLDASGKAQAQFNIPNDSRLSGVRIYKAFVTLSPSAPSGIQSISPSSLLVLN
jgi:hypothetical protein